MRKIQFLAPIALALAVTGCGQATESETAAAGEAIAAIDAPEGQKWSNTVSITEAGGYVMGNPKAPVKLIEYMSLTCGACKAFGEEAYTAIRDNYVDTGRVSFEVRNFVRDPVDLGAAILTRCSVEQAYFPLTEQVLSNQNEFLTLAQAKQADGSLETALNAAPGQRFVSLAESLNMIEFFQQRGVSADQAKACLSDEANAEKLQEYTKNAIDDFNVQGTPTFLVNGQKIEGIAWSLIETKLQEAGAR